MYGGAAGIGPIVRGLVLHLGGPAVAAGVVGGVVRPSRPLPVPGPGLVQARFVGPHRPERYVVCLAGCSDVIIKLLKKTLGNISV